MKRLFALVIMLYTLACIHYVYADDYGLEYVNLGLHESNSLKPAEGLMKSDRLFLEIAKKNNKPELKSKFRALYFYGKAVYYYLKSSYGAYNILTLFFISLLVALFFSIFMLSLSRLIADSPLFVHEIAEAPIKLIYLIPVVLGVLDVRFMLLALLFTISFHLTDKQRKTLIALMVVIFLSYFLYDYENVLLREKNSLPSRAVELVNSSKSNIPAMTSLNRTGVFEEEFSHGLSLLKEHKPERAINVFSSAASRFDDPRIYVNLGYLYAIKGQTKKAEENFNKAINRSATASAYYNLSILSSEKLDFKQADEYFLKAVKLDFQRVTAFRESNGEISTAHYMFDQLSNSEVFRYILDRTYNRFKPQKTTLYSIIYAILLIIVIMLSGKKYKHRAIKCPKCGKIHCIRCERHIYWNGLCGSCYSALVSFQAEPAERIKVILKTYDFSRRQRMIKGLFSFFVPGFLLMQGERMLKGLSHTFLFAFFMVLAILSTIVEPLYLKGIYLWITYPSVLLTAFIYLYSTLYTFKRVRKGWL